MRHKGLTWMLALLLMLLPAASVTAEEGMAEGGDALAAVADFVPSGQKITLLCLAADVSDIQARAWGGMLTLTMGGSATAIVLYGQMDAAAFGKEVQATVYDAGKLSIHLSASAGAALGNVTIETATVMDSAMLCVLGHSTLGQADALGEATLLIAGETLAPANNDWSQTSLSALFASKSFTAWMEEAFPLRDIASYEIPAQTPDAQTFAPPDEEAMAEAAAAHAASAISLASNISARNAARVLLYGAVNARTVWLRNQSHLTADAALADSVLVVSSMFMEHTADANLFGVSMEKATVGGTATLNVGAGTQMQRLFATEQATVNVGMDTTIATIFHRDSASIYGIPADQKVILQFHTH